MSTRLLAHGSRGRTAVVLAIFIGVITSFIHFLAHSSGAEIVSPYYAYAFVVPCLLFGALHPFQATLAALVLISVNPGFPVAHMFTSAPSDYLMASAAASFIVRKETLWANCRLVFVGLSILVVGLTVLLVVALLGGYSIRPSKLFFAEYFGILSMASYVIASVGAAQYAKGGREIIAALALGGVILFVTGSFGGADTIACFTDGAENMYSTAGYRAKGLLGDPNVFAAYVAALAPIMIASFMRRSFLATIAVVAACSALLAVSGSRTGISIGCIAISLSVVLSGRGRLWLIPLCMVAALVVASSPRVLWPSMPCLLDVPYGRVLFTERNDGGAYYSRMIVEKDGVEKILKDSPSIREACDVEERGGGAADRVRDCVVAELSATFVAPPNSTGAFQSSPQMRSWLNWIPLDESRKKLWEHAFSIGSKHPVFGVGLASLPRMTPNGWRSHNTVLTTFAEQGVLGLATLFGTIGLVVVAGIRGMSSLAPECRVAYRALLVGVLICLIASLSQDIIRQPVCWALLGVFATACVPRRVESAAAIAHAP